MNSIEVKNLNKSFRLQTNYSISALAFWKKKNRIGPRKFNALKDINFSVEQGTTFGVIGRNGSGKSTLLRILLGSITPDKGSEVSISGKVLKLAMGAGFNHNLTARENIYINGSILGLKFEEIGNIFHEVLDFAGVAEFVDMPLKYYSAGMNKRLGFSLAIRAHADIILLDEFFGGVGDIEFQAKANNALENYLNDKKTVILVSHNPMLIREKCDKVIWLEKGQIMDYGDSETVVDSYVKFIKKLKHG